MSSPNTHKKLVEDLDTQDTGNTEPESGPSQEDVERELHTTIPTKLNWMAHSHPIFDTPEERKEHIINELEQSSPGLYEKICEYGQEDKLNKLIKETIPTLEEIEPQITDSTNKFKNKYAAWEFGSIETCWEKYLNEITDPKIKTYLEHSQTLTKKIQYELQKLVNKVDLDNKETQKGLGTRDKVIFDQAKKYFTEFIQQTDPANLFESIEELWQQFSESSECKKSYTKPIIKREMLPIVAKEAQKHIQEYLIPQTQQNITTWLQTKEFKSSDHTPESLMQLYRENTNNPIDEKILSNAKFAAQCLSIFQVHHEKLTIENTKKIKKEHEEEMKKIRTSIKEFATDEDHHELHTWEEFRTHYFQDHPEHAHEFEHHPELEQALKEAFEKNKNEHDQEIREITEGINNWEPKDFDPHGKSPLDLIKLYKQNFPTHAHEIEQKDHKEYFNQLFTALFNKLEKNHHQELTKIGKRIENWKPKDFDPHGKTVQDLMKLYPEDAEEIAEHQDIFEPLFSKLLTKLNKEHDAELKTLRTNIEKWFAENKKKLSNKNITNATSLQKEYLKSATPEQKKLLKEHSEDFTHVFEDMLQEMNSEKKEPEKKKEEKPIEKADRKAEQKEEIEKNQLLNQYKYLLSRELETKAIAPKTFKSFVQWFDEEPSIEKRKHWITILSKEMKKRKDLKKRFEKELPEDIQKTNQEFYDLGHRERLALFTKLKLETSQEQEPTSLNEVMENIEAKFEPPKEMQKLLVMHATYFSDFIDYFGTLSKSEHQRLTPLIIGKKPEQFIPALFTDKAFADKMERAFQVHPEMKKKFLEGLQFLGITNPLQKEEDAFENMEDTLPTTEVEELTEEEPEEIIEEIEEHEPEEQEETEEEGEETTTKEEEQEEEETEEVKTEQEPTKLVEEAGEITNTEQQTIEEMEEETPVATEHIEGEDTPQEEPLPIFVEENEEIRTEEPHHQEEPQDIPEFKREEEAQTPNNTPLQEELFVEQLQATLEETQDTTSPVEENQEIHDSLSLLDEKIEEDGISDEEIKEEIIDILTSLDYFDNDNTDTNNSSSKLMELLIEGKFSHLSPRLQHEFISALFTVTKHKGLLLNKIHSAFLTNRDEINHIAAYAIFAEAYMSGGSNLLSFLQNFCTFICETSGIRPRQEIKIDIPTKDLSVKDPQEIFNQLFDHFKAHGNIQDIFLLSFHTFDSKKYLEIVTTKLVFTIHEENSFNGSFIDCTLTTEEFSKGIQNSRISIG